MKPTSVVWNGVTFRRTKSLFMKENTKEQIIPLLDTLGINYKKWTTAQGSSATNIKTFKEKAFEELSKNPRLRPRNRPDSSWFKE